MPAKSTARFVSMNKIVIFEEDTFIHLVSLPTVCHMAEVASALTCTFDSKT